MVKNTYLKCLISMGLALGCASDASAVLPHHMTTVTTVHTEQTKPLSNSPTTKDKVTVTQTGSDKSKSKEIKVTKVTQTENHNTKNTKVDDKPKAPLTASTTAATAVINKLFNKFGNPNSIDKKDIFKLSKDPHLTGQEAATLAALVLAITNSSSQSKVTFTKTELMNYLNNTSSSLYYYYTVALSNINGVRTLPSKQQLDGKGGITYQTQIIQESDNDCYFLSAINSLLQTKDGAEKIRSMITPVPGTSDEYQVKFPGDATAETVKLTDTEIGMYSHLSSGGKWLAILSVGESMRRDQRNFNPEITMDPGYQTQTMRLFTDKKYDSYNFPTHATSLNAKDSKWLTEMITSSLNDNTPIGIQTNVHALSIIGYENGNVIIKNPWGTTGWYNPVTAGSSNKTHMPKSAGPWYYMENGVFSVPLNQITNGFTTVTYAKDTKFNPSTSYMPRLPYPTNNAPSGAFTTPSAQVAPVKFSMPNDNTETGKKNETPKSVITSPPDEALIPNKTSCNSGVKNRAGCTSP